MRFILLEKTSLWFFKISIFGAPVEIAVLFSLLLGFIFFFHFFYVDEPTLSTLERFSLQAFTIEYGARTNANCFGFVFWTYLFYAPTQLE